MSAHNNVNSLVYEPQEQDDEKLHFDIIFNRAFSDILNDPNTLDLFDKIDDQHVDLYNHLEVQKEQNNEPLDL